MVATPRIAVGPAPAPLVQEAIQHGGGLPVAPGEPADGLVWLAGREVAGLRAVLKAVPAIRWVQLPFAGVENFAGQDLFADGRVWTYAKGAYAEVVAEHALALALAGLRQIPDRARAGAWGRRAVSAGRPVSSRGLFAGTCSTSAYAGWAGRECTSRPTRCAFALRGVRE